MRIVGLDLSLTATGFADETGLSTVKVQIPPHANETERMRRLHSIVKELDRRCRTADVVVLEGYAFGAKTNREVMGELGGVVKVVMLQRGVPFVVPPPALLKKFATGKGNASKDEVLIAAVRYFPETHQPTNNNEADAAWLREMARLHYEPSGDIPRYRSEVLEAIKWPQIAVKEGAA